MADTRPRRDPIRRPADFPGPGDRPRPKRVPRYNQGGIRLYVDLVEPLSESRLIAKERDWASELERQLPAGTTLAAMGLGRSKKQYVFDVLASERDGDAVVNVMKSTIGPHGGHFSCKSFREIT